MLLRPYLRQVPNTPAIPVLSALATPEPTPVLPLSPDACPCADGYSGAHGDNYAFHDADPDIRASY